MQNNHNIISLIFLDGYNKTLYYIFTKTKINQRQSKRKRSNQGYRTMFHLFLFCPIVLKKY